MGAAPTDVAPTPDHVKTALSVLNRLMAIVCSEDVLHRWGSPRLMGCEALRTRDVYSYGTHTPSSAQDINAIYSSRETGLIQEPAARPLWFPLFHAPQGAILMTAVLFAGCTFSISNMVSESYSRWDECYCALSRKRIVVKIQLCVPQMNSNAAFRPRPGSHGFICITS